MYQSYFCHEQVYQMQATYDAFVMLKIIHDAGVNLVSDPIKFYCYEWGGQIPIFYQAIERIFGICESRWEQTGYDEENSHIRIPFPQLTEFFTLITTEEADKYHKKFHRMLTLHCDYFEMEMEGSISFLDSHLSISLKGTYGVYSPFLKQIVAVRKEVLEVIRERKERMVQRLRNVVMMKMVFDRIGRIADVPAGAPTDEVFSRLMLLCNPDHAFEAKEMLSYETMVTMLRQILEQGEHKISRKGEAA